MMYWSGDSGCAGDPGTRCFHPDGVNRGSGREEHRFVVWSAPGAVGWKFGKFDGSQVAAVGIEDPAAARARAVYAAFRIDFHSIWDSFFC